MPAQPAWFHRLDEILEDQKSGDYTATKWTPMEISIVTVPADNLPGQVQLALLRRTPVGQQRLNAGAGRALAASPSSSRR